MKTKERIKSKIDNQKSIGITGTGFYVPEKNLSNFDLEKKIETSDEWIRTRTGIKNRRVASGREATSDLAYKAGKKALSNANLKASEIDLIIVATLSPDMLFPSTACIVQHKLKAKNAVAFDISAACTGFIYGISMAKSLMLTNNYKTALIIGAEVFSRIIDWKDRNTCVLFGDGAGAVVLEKAQNEHNILSTYLGSDGSGAILLNQPAGGSKIPASHESIDKGLHYLKMDGGEVYKLAVEIMVKSVKKVLNQEGLDENDIDILIPHQANIRILKKVAMKLNLPIDNVMMNIDKYGNTSAASIPIALSESVMEKKIKKGDIVVLVAFGAGLTWGASVIRW